MVELSRPWFFGLLLLRNAWLDSGYMFMFSSGWLLDEFPVFSSCGRFTFCSVLILLVTIRPVLCSFVCRLVMPRSSSTSAVVCALVMLVLDARRTVWVMGFFMSCSMEKCTQSMLRLRGLPDWPM